MAVIATGFFDGVHLGHRLVLDTLVSCARKKGQEAIVVTFKQHPRVVLQQDASMLRLLNSPEEKRTLLMAAGIDRVEYVDFTPAFAALTTREYLQFLKDRFGATTIILGYDNRIGSDQLDPEKTSLIAKELSLDTVVVGECNAVDGSCPGKTVSTLGRVRGRGPLPEAVGGMERSGSFAGQATIGSAISSTKIRRALQEGDVCLAAQMLGYRYMMSGEVVHGNKIGRTLGYPTANISLAEPLKMIPGNGVYLVEAEVDGRNFWGMANIGVRPTVGGVSLTVETHIFDFSEDIYGHTLTIRFATRLRGEQKFASLDELKKNLAADEVRCREMLNDQRFRF